MQKNTTRPFTYLPSVHPTPYQYALIVRSNGASMRLSSCCYWYSCCNYCVCIVCSKLLINEVCLTRTNMIVQCYGRLYFLASHWKQVSRPPGISLLLSVNIALYIAYTNKASPASRADTDPINAIKLLSK